MKPFVKHETIHPATKEVFWALKMPINFTIPGGFASTSYKAGDYICVKGDGWLFGKTKKEVEDPEPSS